MDATETGVEANTSVGDETAEAAPQTETIEETIENFTLDDLMNYSAEQDPLFADDAQHKGMRPLNEWIHNVPEDVRKHLANIRGDYTRKTQELAAMRKQVEAAQRAMEAQNQAITNGSMARQLRDVDETAEYDLFDVDGMKAEIERQAKLMLRDMMAPAQEELEVKQRRMALQQFKADNPEITDPAYRAPMIELLKNRPELKMEDAFYIVKAKVGSTKLQQERNEIAARKAERRSVVRKSSTGSRSNPSGTPQFKNALEAFKWHKSQQTK